MDENSVIRNLFYNLCTTAGPPGEWKCISDHGLYGGTSCCISHGPCQWEMAIFDPHSSETPGPIFVKLEIYNYLPDTTPHAKFQGATSTWVVWACYLASLTHESCPFFVSSPHPRPVVKLRGNAGERRSPSVFRGGTLFPSSGGPDGRTCRK